MFFYLYNVRTCRKLQTPNECSISELSYEPLAKVPVYDFYNVNHFRSINKDSIIIDTRYTFIFK